MIDNNTEEDITLFFQVYLKDSDANKGDYGKLVLKN